MAEDASSQVLARLRDIGEALGRVENEIGEIKGRLFAVEAQLGRSTLHQTGFQVQMAALLSRIDRFEDRFARIERRLDRAGGHDK